LPRSLARRPRSPPAPDERGSDLSVRVAAATARKKAR
jgi:hypothetical protein